MTTITITLRDDLEQWLKDYTEETGQTNEEAMETALRFWQGTQDIDLSGWDEEDLRAEIQKGFDSGEATPWDKKAFLEYANARFKARNG